MKPVALPYPDTLETIGDYLKTRRLDLGLFQKDVARQLGVTTCTITNWEKNDCSPKLYLIPRVIDFLGYNPVEDYAKTRLLGGQLGRTRQRLGMTQKDLARQLGAHPTTPYYWKHDLRQPVPEHRTKLEAFVDEVYCRRRSLDPNHIATCANG